MGERQSEDMYINGNEATLQTHGEAHGGKLVNSPPPTSYLFARFFSLFYGTLAFKTLGGSLVYGILYWEAGSWKTETTIKNKKI